MDEHKKLISTIELEAIRRRCDSATPGPWKASIEGRDHTSGSSCIVTANVNNRKNGFDLSGATDADIEFIAHARQDIPRLLAEIARLKQSVRHDPTNKRDS